MHTTDDLCADARAALHDVVARLDELGAPFALVVDIENTLVPYRTSPARARDLLQAAEQALDGYPRLRCLILLSNSRTPFDVHDVARSRTVVSISRARKPWTRLSLLNGLAAGVPIAGVCGDQPLTDGVLAWRLGVPYHPIRLDRSREPVWPLLLRAIGTPLLAGLHRLGARSRVEGQ